LPKLCLLETSSFHNLPFPSRHKKTMKRATMNRRIVALLPGLAAAFALSGCVATTVVAGNEIGGAIPMAGLTRQQAAEMARAHCLKYGHSSRMLAIRSDGGEKAVFECI
jgi:hypothetical protein